MWMHVLIENLFNVKRVSITNLVKFRSGAITIQKTNAGLIIKNVAFGRNVLASTAKAARSSRSPGTDVANVGSLLGKNGAVSL